MKSKLFLGMIVLLIILGLVLVVKGYHQAGLLSPKLAALSQRSGPSPSPSPTPKSFYFNSSSNLNDELDSVNPALEDEDFLLLTTTIQLLESILK